MNAESHEIQPKRNAVAYYRVSTQRQGMNGLGMDAQRHIVARFAKAEKMAVLGEFAEVESGKNCRRPELGKAIALCKKAAARLVIAKLDRLARNASFVLNLRDSGVDFVACDMPDANKLTVGIMALMAEQERDQTSERTRCALAAARRRGVTLGNPRIAEARELAIQKGIGDADDFARKLAPIVERIRGKRRVRTLRDIAMHLNEQGIQTPRGKKWRASAVRNLLARIESLNL